MSGGFQDLGLLPELVQATEDMGWMLPSDVQDEAIPLILGGGDVMVAAETGSGKTGAFALPAIQIVHETRRAAAAAADAAPKSKRPRVDPGFKLNLHDRSPNVAIAPDGLTCQTRTADWGGVRGTRGLREGKAYYEAFIRDEGLCRFGWSKANGAMDLGTDGNGWGFGGTGKKSHAASFVAYGEPFGKGDVVGCYLEIPKGGKGCVIRFAKNGKVFEDAFTFALPPGEPVFPMICMKNAECGVNFGEAPFRFPPGAGSGFLGLASLPPSVLAVGSDAAGGKGANGGGGGSGSPKGSGEGPVCIVLEPARDLAEQTAKAFDAMAARVADPAITTTLIIGGVEAKEVRAGLKAAPDVVVATPGKFVDLIERDKLSLAQVRLFILDEADRFCDVENLAMINKIFAKIRASIDTDAAPGRLQVCFFSATLHSPEIGKLSDALCKNPTWVDLKGKDSVPETVHHVMIPVDPDADGSWIGPPFPVPGDKSFDFATDGVHAGLKISGGPHAGAAGPSGGPPDALRSEGIKRLKQRMLVSLIDSLRMDQCIIFCRTNLDCDNLERYLTAVGGGDRFRGAREKGKENAYSAVVLAGMRSMEERRRNLEAFKAGDVRFLICTDVAARGLDIKELPYVVNMTLPDEAENYIHRIGRVGRADRMGLAISLVATRKEQVWYHTCANRGKGCSDTRLKDKGGCTVWYDEPAMLGAIQKRLGSTEALPTMGVTLNGPGPDGVCLPYAFSLPPSIAELGVVYGEERGVASGPNEHVEAIRDQVQVLAGLEVKAQASYLALKLKYSRA